MSLGVFTLIKNEAPWVGFSVMAARHLVDQFVFFDGNSTDGTVKLLGYLRDKYHLPIEVYTGKDPDNLQGDYVRLFNECLGKLKTSFAWFLHPDMVAKPGSVFIPGDGLACTVGMRSVAGDPGGPLSIIEGRAERWKSIHSNAFGLHYFGHYGAHNEDMYFRDITGDQHTLYSSVNNYPYDVSDSGIACYHFSDVRPYERRHSRMVKCLENQGYVGDLKKMAEDHPRVSLKSGGGFEFKPFDDVPAVFIQYAREFAAVLGKPVSETCWLPMSEESVRA